MTGKKTSYDRYRIREQHRRMFVLSKTQLVFGFIISLFFSMFFNAYFERYGSEILAEFYRIMEI